VIGFALTNVNSGRYIDVAISLIPYCICC